MGEDGCRGWGVLTRAMRRMRSSLTLGPVWLSQLAEGSLSSRYIDGALYAPPSSFFGSFVSSFHTGGNSFRDRSDPSAKIALTARFHTCLPSPCSLRSRNRPIIDSSSLTAPPSSPASRRATLSSTSLSITATINSNHSCQFSHLLRCQTAQLIAHPTTCQKSFA